MTIFALYIFDRHCECVYYQDWHRTRTPRPPQTGDFKPCVARYASNSHGGAGAAGASGSAGGQQMKLDGTTSGRLIAVNNGSGYSGDAQQQVQGQGGAGGPGRSGTAGQGLPFDEEAKLVYGVVLSLRNMVKKLSGRDENFIAYRTSAYKLHLYETPSGYKLILLSDPLADSLRFVLRQVYAGPFLEYVVRNPLVTLDDREKGVDNDQFRSAVDRYMRSLAAFGA